MGGMEEMGEVVYLAPVGLKDREERWDLREQSEVGEKKGRKVPMDPKD